VLAEGDGLDFHLKLGLNIITSYQVNSAWTIVMFTSPRLFFSIYGGFVVVSLSPYRTGRCYYPGYNFLGSVSSLVIILIRCALNNKTTVRTLPKLIIQ
jgi:hypothetical protein